MNKKKGKLSDEMIQSLCREIKGILSVSVPNLEGDFSEIIKEIISKFEGEEIKQCRNDVIQDLLDTIYEELLFGQLVESINKSYNQDIEDMKQKLQALEKQRIEDIKDLHRKRYLRLKSGDFYPHTGGYEDGSKPKKKKKKTKKKKKKVQNTIDVSVTKSPTKTQIPKEEETVKNTNENVTEKEKEEKKNDENIISINELPAKGLSIQKNLISEDGTNPQEHTSFEKAPDDKIPPMVRENCSKELQNLLDKYGTQ